MPIPFERFRLLNGSDRPIKKYKAASATQAELRRPSQLDAAADMDDVPPGGFREDSPAGWEDVRNFASEIEMDESAVGAGDQRRLGLWQLFWPDDPAFPDANCLREVEIFVGNYPSPPNNEYYATVTMSFLDGLTEMVYFSSRMTG